MFTHYRIYFHKRENAPQVWSIDQGSLSSEIHVQWVKLIGVEVFSNFALDVPEGHPNDWMLVFGRAELSNGGVTIYGS